VRARALLIAGDAAFGMGSYTLAAARYGELAAMPDRLSPEMPRAAFALGWAELRQGRPAQARRAWTRFADRFPADERAPVALLGAAELAARAGDVSTSRRLLDRVIAQHPTTPVATLARLSRAVLALHNQREDEALRDLEHAVRIGGPPALEGRARLHQALAVSGGGFRLDLTRATTARAAGDALDRFAAPIVERRHREPTPHLHHGLLLLAARDRGWSDPLTATLARRLLEDFPSHEPASVLLIRVARAAAVAGQWPLARGAWETLMVRLPHTAAARAGRVPLAEALAHTGATTDARATLEQVASGGGDDAPRALLLLAELHDRAGERRAALAVYDRLLREHPRTPRTPASLLRHAQLLEDAGQVAGARPLLHAVVQTAQGESAAEAAYRLGRGLTAERQHAAALEWYLTAAYVGDTTRWARRALLESGRAFTALQQPSEALAAYWKLVAPRAGFDPADDPEPSGEAAYLAGELLRTAGLHDEALGMFARSAELTAGSPAEPRALVGALESFVATGDRAAAERVYRRLLAAHATPEALAQARRALGIEEGAESALPRAVR
jgi:TolA-binding protein